MLKIVKDLIDKAVREFEMFYTKPSFKSYSKLINNSFKRNAFLISVYVIKISLECINFNFEFLRSDAADFHNYFGNARSRLTETFVKLAI